MLKCSCCGETRLKGATVVECNVRRIYEVVANKVTRPPELKSRGEQHEDAALTLICSKCGEETTIATGTEIEFV